MMRSTPPPPSPIPTGKGSRCAANQSFTEYLEKSLHRLPELELPDSSFHVTSRPQVLADIDYGFLRSRSPESVDRMEWSAKEFGLFRIMGCGIPGEVLRALAEEAGNYGRRASVEKAGSEFRRERLATWVWSNGGTLKFSQGKNVGDQTKLKRSSHEIVENVARRLDAIATQVILVLQERMSKEIQCMESVISLYRYSDDKDDGVAVENQRGSSRSTSEQMNEEGECRNTALLRFHLPLEQTCQFYAQSQRGPLSFDTSPSALVVTIGKQLEEWSGGVLGSVSEEKMWRPKVDGGGATLGIEFRCLSARLLDGNESTYSDKHETIISLSDQVMIALCLLLLHKLVYLLFLP